MRPRRTWPRWLPGSISWAVAIGALLASCSRGPEPGSLSGWNVLLITIDTLRQDRVGFMGYRAAATPVMDGLAEAAVVFENAISSAPVTLPSHATILTGLYPPQHGALDNGFYSLPAEVPTLAEILGGAGYQTSAVIGAYVLHGQYGLDEGFDQFDDFFRRPRAENEEHRERRAGEVVEKALAWLEARDPSRPFFLWTHFYDPHAPYDPPPPFRGRFATRPYDGEIAFTDASIGKLLEGLSNAGASESTLIVITSDHGEAFGDGGETTHGLLLRGTTLHVPLLFAASALPQGRRVSGVVSTADIAPTILDLLGVATPHPMSGRSLAGPMRSGSSEGRLAYSETRLPLDMYGWSMLSGIRSDRWVWVRGPRAELYDLQEDPEEIRSLHEMRPEVASELDAQVEEILKSARESDPKQSLPPEEVEALRALGYVFAREAPKASGRDPKDMIATWHRVNDVRALFGAGAHREALKELNEILDDDPGNLEARMLRGQCLVQIGQAEEGIQEFQGLFNAGVARGRAGTIFARTLAEAGRPEEAEALLRAFMKSEPEFGEHAYNLGVLLSQQGRYEEAREAYEIAYRENPDAVHVLANLAEVLSRVARTEVDSTRAVELLEKAIGLSAEDDRPRLILAKVCARFGDVERAEQETSVLAKRRILQGITREELAEFMRKL